VGGGKREGEIGWKNGIHAGLSLLPTSVCLQGVSKYIDHLKVRQPWPWCIGYLMMSLCLAGVEGKDRSQWADVNE